MNKKELILDFLKWFDKDLPVLNDHESLADEYLSTQPPKEGCIIHDGFKYWYEYKLARNRVDICLGTKEPDRYCNGLFLYSQKDEGDGMEFVIIKTDNPEITINPPKEVEESRCKHIHTEVWGTGIKCIDCGKSF